MLNGPHTGEFMDVLFFILCACVWEGGQKREEGCWEDGAKDWRKRGKKLRGRKERAKTAEIMTKGKTGVVYVP